MRMRNKWTWMPLVGLTFAAIVACSGSRSDTPSPNSEGDKNPPPVQGIGGCIGDSGICVDLEGDGGLVNLPDAAVLLGDCDPADPKYIEALAELAQNGDELTACEANSCGADECCFLHVSCLPK